MSASSASNSIAEGTTPVGPTLSLLDDTADDGASKMYLEEATHAQIAQDAFLGFAFTSLSDKQAQKKSPLGLALAIRRHG